MEGSERQTASGKDSVGTVQTSRLGPFGFFEGLGPDDLAFIAVNCSEVTATAGSLLIQEGQVGREVYLLEEGSVKVYRGDAKSPRKVAVLEAPTIVGELALVDPARIRTSSVLALSDLRLLSIPITTFLAIVGAFPGVKSKLREVIDARR
jgi:CRP-like cAMP-binding protein